MSSLFLFFQCLHKNIKKLGLQKYLKENKEAKNFVKQLKGLAFLPHEKIKSEYKKLCQRTSPSVMKKLKRFREYWTEQWLKRVPPKYWSIFGLSVRTTNAIEAHHALLLRRLEVHPSAWIFISMMCFKDLLNFGKWIWFNEFNILVRVVRLIDLLIVDIKRLRNGKIVTRQPRYKTKYRQAELRRSTYYVHFYN